MKKDRLSAQSFIIPPPLKQRLKITCAHLNRGQSDVVCELIEKWLENNEVRAESVLKSSELGERKRSASMAKPGDLGEALAQALAKTLAPLVARLERIEQTGHIPGRVAGSNQGPEKIGAQLEAVERERARLEAELSDFKRNTPESRTGDRRGSRKTG